MRRLFDERDRRFSRFIESSELNRVNAAPRGVTVVSEELASMLSLAFDAAHATGGLVTPAVGGAMLAAGYDRDFSLLPPDSSPVEPAAVPSIDSMVLRGRILLRVEPLILDLNGVVKGRTVDDALALLGDGWVSAGGDLATTYPIVVGLPGGDTVTLDRGGARDEQRREALLAAGRPSPAPSDRSGERCCLSRARWRDVTVAAPTCLAADIAAKAALLLDDDRPGVARRARARRPVRRPRRHRRRPTASGPSGVPLEAAA